MYFKFIILLISFFLTTNSVMGNLEELLQNAYNFAREIYYAPTGKGLKSCDISNFVEHVNYKYVENYFEANGITLGDQENINFELFTNIIRGICGNDEFDEPDESDFLTSRIRDLELEVKECEELYNLVKSQYTATSGKKLTDANLIEYFGTTYKSIIKEYMEKNNVSFKDKKNVDLKLFTNIVRAVCKSNEYFERPFLRTRLMTIKGKGKAILEEQVDDEEAEEEDDDED